MSRANARLSDQPAGNAYAGSTGPDRKTLDVIFRHPLAHSLVWREVVALMTSIGRIDEKRSGEFLLQARGETLSLYRPHTKDVVADDVVALRHFLTRAGWAPGAPPATAGDGRAAGVVVVIDHAGARVFAMDGAEGDAADGEARVRGRRIDRADHDRDREERFPEDMHFFEQVALDLGGHGPIVLIGHGKGQSNEAHHFSDYLLRRHKATHARIVSTLTADLPRLSDGELMALGRDALA